MKKHGSTILLYLVLIIGLSLMLYPTFSDWWNSFTQSRAIATYAEEVSMLDSDAYDEIWNTAWDYNQELLSRPNAFLLSEETEEVYDALLNLSGTGIMGYIEIPSIKVTLPVYHGRSGPAGGHRSSGMDEPSCGRHQFPLRCFRAPGTSQRPPVYRPGQDGDR